LTFKACFLSFIMDSKKKEYELEVNRGNWVRALYLAKELNLDPDKIKEIAHNALWLLGGIARNPYAIKKLAEELGYSKEEIKEILLQRAKHEEEVGNNKVLGECYDYKTDRYLSFNKWLERLLKEWNKIN